jgi:Family of unknown function (DUF6445)
MSYPYTFALNPSPQVTVHRVGREQEPVIVIDGLMRDPASLVEFAAREVAFRPVKPGQNFYPGVQEAAPLDYVATVGRTLSPLVQETFGMTDARPGSASCNLSLVTLRPEQLNLAQRLPHVDTVDPLQIAFLHYLCDPRFGGTAFYRHRATGFETLTPERLPTHQRALDAELAQAAPGATYITGDTPLYEQTAAFDAQFDRMLIYRSRVFHSGQINPDAGLSADPRTGRLTANIFLSYRR